LTHEEERKRGKGTNNYMHEIVDQSHKKNRD